jgi:ubiquinone/menaquinone biosynthesis C-methylase UbiE
VTEKVTRFFDGTEMPTSGWWEALWPDPAAVLAVAGLKPGMEVIDLCSGDGWFTLPIARVAKRVVAIDIDPVLLETARRRMSERDIGNCHFIPGDAFRIAELWPPAVDFVFMANAFHGVPDKPKLALSVEKALKPGGRFSVVNWHARPREETVVLGEPRGPRAELRLGPEETKMAVEAETVLKLTRVLEIPPHHYAAIFTKPF